MKHLLILMMVIFCFNTLAALENQNKTWLGIFGKKKLQDHDFSVWQEIQYRYDFEQGGMQQLLTRLGLLKSLNNSHEVGLIMGYIQTRASNVGAVDSKEYRPTLQHVYNTALDEHKLTFRSRLEWRDEEDRETNSIRYRLQNSYRYQISPTYSLLFWEEPFLNLSGEKWVGNRLVERNRLFIGMRLDQGTDHRFEIGYMNQYVPKKFANRTDVSEHVLVGYFFF